MDNIDEATHKREIAANSINSNLIGKVHYESPASYPLNLICCRHWTEI